jgi:hypothetical protein
MVIRMTADRRASFQIPNSSTDETKKEFIVYQKMVLYRALKIGHLEFRLV